MFVARFVARTRPSHAAAAVFRRSSSSSSGGGDAGPAIENRGRKGKRKEEKKTQIPPPTPSSSAVAAVAGPPNGSDGVTHDELREELHLLDTEFKLAFTFVDRNLNDRVHAGTLRKSLVDFGLATNIGELEHFMNRIVEETARNRAQSSGAAPGADGADGKEDVAVAVDVDVNVDADAAVSHTQHHLPPAPRSTPPSAAAATPPHSPYDTPTPTPNPTTTTTLAPPYPGTHRSTAAAASAASTAPNTQLQAEDRPYPGTHRTPPTATATAPELHDRRKVSFAAFTSVLNPDQIKSTWKERECNAPPRPAPPQC